MAMTCCPHCEDAEDFFDPRTARRDLRRYRSRGPSATTQLLIDAILAQKNQDETLLDVGGGVGAISHELIGAGFVHATQVDASRPYLEASENEAVRRGHSDRTEYHFGDFVDVAPTLNDADVVTLDRVVCCYPDAEKLITASAEKARHLYGLVYPRERAITRAGIAAGNLWFRYKGSAFRAYLHPTDLVEAILKRCGFLRTSIAHSFLWQVATFARA